MMYIYLRTSLPNIVYGVRFIATAMVRGIEDVGKVLSYWGCPCRYFKLALLIERVYTLFYDHQSKEWKDDINPLWPSV